MGEPVPGTYRNAGLCTHVNNYQETDCSLSLVDQGPAYSSQTEMRGGNDQSHPTIFPRMGTGSSVHKNKNKRKKEEKRKR